MDEKFNALLSIAIIPKTVDLISQKEQIDEMTALNEFYKSSVYALLSQENTKIWHYSPLTLYSMWKSEKNMGQIEFPEGA